MREVGERKEEKLLGEAVAAEEERSSGPERGLPGCLSGLSRTSQLKCSFFQEALMDLSSTLGPGRKQPSGDLIFHRCLHSCPACEGIRSGVLVLKPGCMLQSPGDGVRWRQEPTSTHGP